MCDIPDFYGEAEKIHKISLTVSSDVILGYSSYTKILTGIYIYITYTKTETFSICTCYFLEMPWNKQWKELYEFLTSVSIKWKLKVPIWFQWKLLPTTECLSCLSATTNYTDLQFSKHSNNALPVCHVISHADVLQINSFTEASLIHSVASRPRKWTSIQLLTKSILQRKNNIYTNLISEWDVIMTFLITTMRHIDSPFLPDG